MKLSVNTPLLPTPNNKRISAETNKNALVVGNYKLRYESAFPVVDGTATVDWRFGGELRFTTHALPELCKQCINVL